MNRSKYEVLIYCPLDGGHHLNFARLVTAGFRRLGVGIVLATTERGARSRELATAEVQIRPLRPRQAQGRLVSLWEELKDLQGMVGERHWNRIVLPSGDGLLQILGMAAENGIRIFRPGQTIEALAIRGSVAYPASRILHLKHEVSVRFLEKAPVSVRHHLDPVFIDWVAVQPPPRTEWRLMPDPVEIPPPLDRQTARSLLKIPVDGVVVGCVGVLDERKGVDLLANAFASSRLPSDAHLLLVGTCTAGVKAAVAKLRARRGFAGRVHLVDEWVTDEIMMRAIAAMDLVVTAYPGHVGSASIVLRVMAAGRPVLGSPTPWIARHVSQYKAGWVSDVGNPEAFAADLARAAENALSWQPSPHVSELLAFNSPENFMAHWTRATAVELGCSPIYTLLPAPRISSAHPE